jgi:serine/threonine protein kinase
MPLSKGDKLGHHEILSLLGQGGMGQVYKALDTQLKREVALKTLLPAFARDPERYARFQREAEVLASLNHPNIATLYGIAEGALVMEFVELNHQVKGNKLLFPKVGEERKLRGHTVECRQGLGGLPNSIAAPRE